jgi:hypothetical protein
VNLYYGRLQSGGSLVPMSKAWGKGGRFLSQEKGLAVAWNVAGDGAVLYKLQERNFAT